MTLKIWAWIWFVASTAILPALVIGAIAKSNGWAAKRCFRTAEVLVLGAWLANWFVFPFLAGRAPFGIPAFRWVTENPEPPWRLLWLAAPVVAPGLARKIAFPEYSFWRSLLPSQRKL